jgi:hypothetical protein
VAKHFIQLKEEGKMKALRWGKPLATLVALLLILGLAASQAYAWGSAAHCLFDDLLNRQKQGQKNLGERYGGMAPDLFNYLFASYQPDLYGLTHDHFLKVWEAAGPGKASVARALGFGFVSHNDLWGADYTAHHNGLTFGQGEGYIIAKAQLLKSTLIEALAAVGLTLPDAVALELSHNFVEFGVDVLVKNLDSQIGSKMVAAALRRNPTFPTLLVRAYGEEVAAAMGASPQEAARLIAATEQSFRQIKIYEGQALMEDVETAVALLSEELANFAQAYLASFGIELPPDITHEQIVFLAENFIFLAMGMCKDDFAGEIQATIVYVNQQLEVHGISY